MNEIAANPWTATGFTARRNEPRLLAPKEVASRLGLSRSAVYAMVADGRIPAVTLGESRRARIRVDERELEAWLYGDAA